MKFLMWELFSGSPSIKKSRYNIILRLKTSKRRTPLITEAGIALKCQADLISRRVHLESCNLVKNSLSRELSKIKEYATVETRDSWIACNAKKLED